MLAALWCICGGICTKADAALTIASFLQFIASTQKLFAVTVALVLLQIVWLLWLGYGELVVEEHDDG